jgi:hypothetical protein
MANKRVRCVRCELLDRRQKSKSIHYITNNTGDKIPVCSVCLLEIKEEEDYLESLKRELEDDGFSRSSEEFD